MKKLIKSIRGDGEEGLGMMLPTIVFLCIILPMLLMSDDEESKSDSEGVWEYDHGIVTLTWEEDDENLTYVMDNIQNQSVFFQSIGEDEDFVYYVQNGETGEFKSEEYYELAKEESDANRVSSDE